MNKLSEMFRFRQLEVFLNKMLHFASFIVEIIILLYSYKIILNVLLISFSVWLLQAVTLPRRPETSYAYSIVKYPRRVQTNLDE